MRKKTKKKANKNDEIIQLLREILEELRKLNENTNNGNLAKPEINMPKPIITAYLIPFLTDFL